MVQADSPHTTTLPADPPQRGPTASRRALLMGVAAGAVTALPLSAASAPSDDAELLALKPAFDKLFDEWVRTATAEIGEREEYVAAICRETGLKAQPASQDDPEGWAKWEAASRRYLNATYGGGDREQYYADFNSAIGSLAEEIFAYVPTTLDGLKLQARALMAVDDDLVWANRAWDDEPDYPRLAAFFEALCGFLEIPFPPVPAGEEVRT
jgi:hypothetical protein